MENDIRAEYRRKLFDVFKCKETNEITVESLKYCLYQADIKGVSEQTIEVCADSGDGEASGWG